MTSLNALVEAAKLVEYDKDGIPKNSIEFSSKMFPELVDPRNKHSISVSVTMQRREIEDGLLERDTTRPGGGLGLRETHNKLEKNRRAELKNYFQKLKHNLPRLTDKSKASNVSILTEAVKYIAELNAIDRNYEDERIRLRKCRMCYEERIKMLKEDLHRHNLQKQLFVQVQHEKKRANEPTTKPVKEMKTVEVQANEEDINHYMNLATSCVKLKVNIPPKKPPTTLLNSIIVKPSKQSNDKSDLPNLLCNVVGEKREPPEEISKSAKKFKLMDSEETDSEDELKIVVDEE